MTREEIVAAVKTLLADGGVDAFELDEVPTDITRPYVELHLSTRGVVGERKMSGTTDAQGWRLQLRACGRLVGNVHALLGRSRGALYGARLADSGGAVGTRIFEHLPGDPPGPDGKWFTALDEYTFTS